MAKKATKKTKSPAAAKAASAKPAAAKKVAAAPVAAPTAPTAAAVSARAHQIWISRGKPTPGTPLEDWVQAERELGLRKS